MEEKESCGVGNLTPMDQSKMRVVIAVVIDGGPVTQEEQRTVSSMVDEVVFDLRRRGVTWAKSAAVLIARFPDVEAFIQSLDRTRNLMRAAMRFPTRQKDEHKWNTIFFQMSLAWEVPENCPHHTSG